MAINVIFDKNGFHHPVFGRMGRGRYLGKVYSLPDAFSAVGMLPSTASIIDKEDLEDVLEEEEQRKPIKPQILDEERYEKVTGGGKRPKAQSARERTTGAAPKRTRKKIT